MSGVHPCVWFGFFFFNGISTFVGYLIPKPLLSKDNSTAVYSIAWYFPSF